MINHGLRECWLAEAKTMCMLCSYSFRSGGPWFDKSTNSCMAEEADEPNTHSFVEVSHGEGWALCAQGNWDWVRLCCLHPARSMFSFEADLCL